VLNAWAASLIGDARRVRCTVEHLQPDSGTVIARRTLRLSDVPISPLDLVYGAGASGDPVRNDNPFSDIEERILWQARREPHGFGPDAHLRLQHGPPSDLAPGDLTLLDAIEQARAIRSLLDGARAVDPDDLQPPERPTGGVFDLTELERRAKNAEDALITAHRTLTTLVEHNLEADLEQLREALLALSSFGIERSIPVSAAGENAAIHESLLRQAQAVARSSAPRLDCISALRSAAAAGDMRRERDALLERVRNVFGPAFAALPLFTCDPAAATEFADSLGASMAVQDGDPLAIHTWYLRAERVRDGLARLAAPLRGAEILGHGPRLEPRIAQLPFTPDDRWVGLPATGRAPPSGKLSLVVQTDHASFSGPMAGLWVDEWVEVVPSREESTAIAFQFNPPDACAPQGILLAVPPDQAEPWTPAVLYRILAETLDLAKLRAVDMEALGEVAHYLPALFLAFNAEDDAVSTDFEPLTR
jgi:hypothetical protein